MEFGALTERDPAGSAAQALVERVRSFITEHYYNCNCTPEILAALGCMYSGGEISKNIDRAAAQAPPSWMAMPCASTANGWKSNWNTKTDGK